MNIIKPLHKVSEVRDRKPEIPTKRQIGTLYGAPAFSEVINDKLGELERLSQEGCSLAPRDGEVPSSMILEIQMPDGARIPYGALEEKDYH